MIDATSSPSAKLIKDFYLSELELRQNLRKSYSSLKQYELIRAYSFFQKQEDLLSKEVSLFPFENLLKHLSKSFSRMMELGAQLKIPFEVQFRTPRRLVAEWKPFSGKTFINPIQSELAWLVERPVTKILRSEFNALLQMNTNQFHDRSHSVFFLLMPAPKGTKDLNDYFVFIEALVCVSEIFVSMELGQELAEYFVSFHSLSRSLKQDGKYLSQVTGREEIFKTALANLLTRFHAWSLSERKKLPKHCPFVRTPAFDTPEYVVQQMFPDWAKGNRDKVYPQSFRNRKISLPRIYLDSFAVSEVLKEDQLDLIWKWYKQVLFVKRPR